MERGKYIVLEGADGTGKSEQAKAIAERLRGIGRNVLLLLNDETGLMEPIQEPGGVLIANEQRKIIKNKNLERDPWLNVMMFNVSRRANWLQAMQPALTQGIDVVTARSWISTVAYQGYGESVDPAKIRQRTLEDVGEEYLHPDLELILAISDEQTRQSLIAQRGPLENPDTFESMPAAFQDSMKNGYVRFALDNSVEIIPVTPNLSADPAAKSASITAVTDQIWQRVEKIL